MNLASHMVQVSFRVYPRQSQLKHWKGSGGDEQGISSEAILSDNLEGDPLAAQSTCVTQIPKESSNGSYPSNEDGTSPHQLRQTCVMTSPIQSAGVLGDKES